MWEELTVAHKTGATAFPDVLRAVPAERLLEAYAAGPRRIREAVRDLPATHLAAHPIPGKWSIAEIVLHLADAEIMGAARVRQAVAEPGSTAAGYDQDRWAAGLAYTARDPDEIDDALTLFELLRRTSLPLFARARDGGRDESVVHPGCASCSSCTPTTASGTWRRSSSAACCWGCRWTWSRS
jgi:hypothetical protein